MVNHVASAAEQTEDPHSTAQSHDITIRTVHWR